MSGLEVESIDVVFVEHEGRAEHDVVALEFDLSHSAGIEGFVCRFEGAVGQGGGGLDGEVAVLAAGLFDGFGGAGDGCVRVWR